MDAESPISLDFGLTAGDSHRDVERSPVTRTNIGATAPKSQSSQSKLSIDSVFGQDVLGQWSPGLEATHARNNSMTSEVFDASENTPDKRLADDDKLPAWSELKTKAGKERKRLPLACIDCRRKKIKCSGEKPACKHCVKARVPCVYKNTARKAAPRTDYMAMLDKRLRRMEDRVVKMLPKEDMPDLSVTGRSSVRPPIPGQPVKKEKPAVIKRTAEDAFALEMKNWTQPKNQSGLDTGPSNRSQRDLDNKLSTEGAEALPPTPIQNHLAEIFFDCVYGQAYLLLHKPSFMRKLKAGSVPPVLVLAVCAISARFSTHPQVSTEPGFLRGEQWATAARKVVEKRHFEPNITILTVMIILGVHYFGTCEGGLSWSFGGQAMRMGYALQLHRELDHDPLGQAQVERETSNGQVAPQVSELSFTDREIRRRLMWACYLLDVFNSSGTERPPFLNEEYIKIQLPIKEILFQQEIPGFTEDIDGHVTLASDSKMESEQAQEEAKANLGVAAYVIRAIVVWKRIVQYLNLGGKEKDPHPIWDPLSQFASLQRQIRQLSSSLPEVLKYTPENLAVHVSERLANQFLFLHIVLAQTSLFLHRFAIPTAPNTHRPYPPNTPKPFLGTCATTVVDSATRVSQILADSTGHTFTAPFAGYCAYTAATVHVWGLFSKHPALEAASQENLRHNYRYLIRMKRCWGMFHYMAESIKDIYRTFAEAAASSSGAKHKIKQFPTGGLSKDTSSTSETGLERAEQATSLTATAANMDTLISADPSRAPSPSLLTGDQPSSDTDTPLSSSTTRPTTEASGKQTADNAIEMDESSSITTATTTTTTTASNKSKPKQPILQYGDWFNKYPHGVSEREWETKHHPHKPDTQRGTEAVMSQKSDLQSVEEFFASLSPPSKAVVADKARDLSSAVSSSSVTPGTGTGNSSTTAAATATATTGTATTTDGSGRVKKIPRRRGKSVVENFSAGAGAAAGAGAGAGTVTNQTKASHAVNTSNKESTTGVAGGGGQNKHRVMAPNITPASSLAAHNQQQRPQQRGGNHTGIGQGQGQGQSMATKRQTHPQNQLQFPDLSSSTATAANSDPRSDPASLGLDLNTSDIDIPMSDFSSKTTTTNNTLQRLQSQANSAFDINVANSPSYFNTNFPSAHRSSLDFDYNSPSTVSNPGSSANLQGPQGHVNFNFNYTSALPHLDRQMVFGAYAGLDPSTTNNSSALNHPNNLNFWGNPWDTMPSGANIPGGSIDMDGFTGFNDIGLNNLGQGNIKSDDAGIMSGSIRPDVTSAPGITGSRMGGNGFGSSGNGNTNFGQNQMNTTAAGLSSSAWFMPFNIEPPVFPGFEDIATFDEMDMSGDFGQNENGNP